MRTEEARPVRLEDYRPPDWLINAIALDVSLNAQATRVRTTLAVKPGSNGGTPAPLVLDGERLRLERVALDGVVLPPEQYVVTANRLNHRAAATARLSTGHRHGDRSVGQHRIARALSVGGNYCTQCEAEGVPADRRISPTDPT